MKIIVAGQDRTQELGQALRQQVEGMRRGDIRRQPAQVSTAISALSLRQAASESDYLDELVRLMRYREGVDTLDFYIPVRPGLGGRLLGRVKQALWKLLRYQHDRITYRQNLINSLLAGALEFESAARRKNEAELNKRIAELEKACGRSVDKIP